MRKSGHDAIIALRAARKHCKEAGIGICAAASAPRCHRGSPRGGSQPDATAIVTSARPPGASRRIAI